MYSGYAVLRINTPDNSSSLEDIDLERLQNWGDSDFSGHHDILVNQDELETVTKKLQANNLVYNIIIEDVQTLIDRSRSSSLLLSPKNAKGHRMTWDKYHRYEEIDSFLDYLARTFPDMVSLETIGKSYEDRIMRVVKVCKNGQCGKNPAMWVDGGIHAREWVAPATVTFMIKELVENRTFYQDLTDNIDWYFLPVLNPDGRYK